MSKEKDKSYDELIGNIEGLLQELDKRDIPLEEAVLKYKTGMELIDLCHKKLEAVEKELKIVEVDN